MELSPEPKRVRQDNKNAVSMNGGDLASLMLSPETRRSSPVVLDGRIKTSSITCVPVDQTADELLKTVDECSDLYLAQTQMQVRRRYIFNHHLS